MALSGIMRADDAAPAAPAPQDQPSVQSDNKQLSDELAAAWKETASLKAQLAEAQAAKGSTPPASPDQDSVADLKDKLATSLRSFSIVQDENADLKASVEKLTAQNATLAQELEAAHASIASLQLQAAATSQIEPLRTQARQAQDEASSLEAENAQLRTRLALLSPGPGTTMPAPLRPGKAPAYTPPPAEAAAPAPVVPAKTYVVLEGDTLTKISRKFYGTTARWEDILKANKDTLKDEKSLAIGSTLTIP
jgi:LysM repeat protein